MEKQCNKCKLIKPKCEFDTKKFRSGNLGLSGSCKFCRNAYAKQAYRANPSNWRTKNKNNYLKHKLGYRNRQLKNNFGISLEEYDLILKNQNGKCAICNKTEGEKRNGKTKYLAVDHCHKTGRIRGLLCGKCNKALGLLEDNMAIINKAIDYLQKGL